MTELTLFPGIEKIYEFCDPLSNPPFRGVPRNPEETLSRCLRGNCRPSQPILIDHAMGGRPLDVIWLTLAGRPIVSDRFVELLRENKFTGWSTYPVTVIGKDGNEVVDYNGFAITGRCGPLDWTHGQRVIRQMRGGSFPYYIGRYFDPESWDGSDVFMSEDGNSTIFVTENVKISLVRAKIRNIRWVRTTEAEISGYLVARSVKHP